MRAASGQPTSEGRPVEEADQPLRGGILLERVRVRARGSLAAEAIDQANKSGKDAFSIYSSLTGSEEEMTINSWEEAKAIAGRDF